jgi:hypothetical protein
VKVSRILTRGRRQTGGLFGGVIPVTASGGEGVSDACAEPDHINDKANAAATLRLGISFFGVPFPATTTRDAEVSSPKHPSAPAPPMLPAPGPSMVAVTGCRCFLSACDTAG